MEQFSVFSRQRAAGRYLAPHTGVAGSANYHETGQPSHRSDGPDRTDTASPGNGGGKPVEPKEVSEELTIKEFFGPSKAGGKVAFVTFEEHSKWGRVKHWLSSEFVLEPGKKALAKIERVPSENPQYPAPELWLREWDGKGERGANAKRGPGGGGGGWKPRSESENLQIMAQSALKSAVDYHTAHESIAAASAVVETAKVFMDGLIKMATENKGKLGS
jgi:hypothetical protein